MFLISRPSPSAIARFLADAQAMSLSYGPIGIARARAVPGFRLDEDTVVVGHGDADFASARDALAAWRHMRLEWLEVFPPVPAIETGTTIALLIRHLGLWSLNASRVVYGVDESTGAYSSNGFAYGTLRDHAERGEEIFQVTLNRLTGDVMYTIRAASQPRALLAKLGAPVVRSLQARFRRDSCDALRRAVTSR
jgi:uncharacterized protein (UPF0548 family)